MRNLIAFNFISLNGYFKGSDEDISWHTHGIEESKYSEKMLALNNILLFGRKTYETMATFWPTPIAKEMFPIVAERMNQAEKIVFSNSPSIGDLWENTLLMNGNIVEKIKLIKQSPGKDLTILGSGSIINHFAEHKLIDEFQIMIDPIAICNGVSLFNGLNQNLHLKLNTVSALNSGAVLLCYKLVD